MTTAFILDCCYPAVNGLVQHIISQSQMKVKPESNFAIQMFAKQPGHVIVSLTVSPHPSSRLQMKDSRKLTDEVQIQVTSSRSLLIE